MTHPSDNPRPGTASAHRMMSRDWAVPLVIAVLTFIVFIPVLQAGFVWDDEANFVSNPYYRGLSWAHLKWMWTSILLGHYVPLTWMSLGVDHELWGMNPTGYHLVNLLLHVTNAILVYSLARRLLELAGIGTGSDTRSVMIPAAFAALFFAIHPLRVESVAWITERRDVLSLVFYLASSVFYLRGGRWYWLSVFGFGCALLSKATVMTLPAVLLILNVYPLRRLGGTAGWWGKSAWRVYEGLIPYFVLAAATAWLSIVALQPGPQLPIAGKLAVSSYSFAFYLWKTLIPTGLSPLYEMPGQVVPTAPVFLASYGIVAVVVALAWSVRKRWVGVTAAGLAFLITILPLLGPVQNGPQIAADRYTYHAAPALALLVASVFTLLPKRRIVTAMGAAVLLMLGVITWRQNKVWQNTETLWTRVVEIDNASSLGNNNLGVVLAERGATSEAMASYRRAIASRPAYADAYSNLGFELAQQGNLEEAVEQYARALSYKPDHIDALINLGNALLDLNRVADAIPLYEAAGRIRPDHPGVHFNWGLALQREGKLLEAIEHLSLSVQLDPSFDDAQRALTRAEVELKAQRAAPPRAPSPR